MKRVQAQYEKVSANCLTERRFHEIGPEHPGSRDRGLSTGQKPRPEPGVIAFKFIAIAC
jgi:hypothetical protein